MLTGEGFATLRSALSADELDVDRGARSARSSAKAGRSLIDQSVARRLSELCHRSTQGGEITDQAPQLSDSPVLPGPNRCQDFVSSAAAVSSANSSFFSRRVSARGSPPVPSGSAISASMDACAADVRASRHARHAGGVWDLTQLLPRRSNNGVLDAGNSPPKNDGRSARSSYSSRMR